MKAIIQDRYGDTGVLDFRDVDRPAVGAGGVLVRVRAAAVSPADWHSMTGRPYLMRAMGFGVRRPNVRVRGWDLAGTVEAVGAGVPEFRPGDEVYGSCAGSFAEYAVAPRGQLAHKPAHLTFEQAAAVPTSGYTALQGLRDVAAGQQVLVIGAGGGVGSLAVQIAKAAGATVTGVCGTAKVDLVRALGADEVVDDTRDEIPGGRFDLILDTAGGRPLSMLRRALTADGSLVIVGAEGGGRWLQGFDRQVRAVLLSPFVRQTLRSLMATNRPEDLATLTRMLTSGELTPVVGRTYALSDAAAAIDHLMEGHAYGKLVLTA